MDFFELVEISTHNLELTSPTSVHMLQAVGENLELCSDHRVVDYGCGYGLALALWAERFGIAGLGVETHSRLCQKAQERIASAGLQERVEIVCENAAAYPVEPTAFDVAVCFGASFIWGGYRQALQRMRTVLKPGGRIVIGEPFYIQKDIPEELVKFEGDLHTEFELLLISREAGYEIEQVLRASQEDWDRYMSGSWYSLLRWIQAHPDHPDCEYVRNYLHRNQEMYFRYQRRFEGWAIFILSTK